MKHITLLVLLLCVPVSSQTSQEEASAEKARLETVLAGLKKGRDSIKQVHDSAAKHLKFNLIKSMIKGAADTQDMIGIESVYDFAWEAIKPYVFDEETYWGYATKKDTYKPYLGADAGERFQDLHNMYAVMQDVLKTKDLKRFDSDARPFRYTSRWWSPPDFKEDGWLQTITRRIYVIRELSGKILEKTEREIAAVEKEVARLSGEQGPAKAGIFEKRYANGKNELTVKITDVETLKVDPSTMRDQSFMGGNVYLSAPASSCMVTVTYRLEGESEYDTVYVNAGITELDAEINTVSRKYIESDHHKGKGLFAGEFRFRVNTEKNIMEPLIHTFTNTGDIYVQFFIAPYEMRSVLVNFMKD
jgi:hypothetical protein